MPSIYLSKSGVLDRTRLKLLLMASNQCEDHGSLELYPPKVWGLDYHFNSCWKMYVAHILEMKEYPNFTGRHTLC